jgi:tRNA(adenine34) deaminase
VVAGAGSPSDEDFMRLALAEAEKAGGRGDIPIGALIVRDGSVIAASANEREARNDPTAHAEVLALQAAAGVVGSWRLNGCTMFVTLEPCPMCAGALVLARIDRLVWGAQNTDAGAALTLYNIPQDPRLNHQMEITPGVLAEDCGDILKRFFADRRRSPDG